MKFDSQYRIGFILKDDTVFENDESFKSRTETIMAHNNISNILTILTLVKSLK